MTSLVSYDKEKLREIIIAALSQNEIIFYNWAIGEIASGIEKFNINKYDKHLSKVFELTLQALEQLTSVETVQKQKGGGFPIKVIILSIIFGIFYGFLNHEVANQVDKGFIEIQDQIIKASEDMGETNAYHTGLVLKNLPENVISNSCNLYDPNTAKFIENKPEKLEIKLIGDKDEATKNMDMAKKALVKYNPKSLSSSEGKELTEFTKFFKCQTHNIATAIYKDAELIAWKMYGEITEDIKTPSLKEQILSGFGLLANPTETATNMIGNVEHTLKQGERRVAIQFDRAKILNTRFQILVSNINNIVKNRGLNVRNLVIAKNLAGAISLAGVKYLAPGVPEFTASALTSEFAKGITFETLNLLEDKKNNTDIKGGKKRKRKTKKNKKNKKKTKKAKKSKKKKNKKSKKTKKARKKRR